MSIVDNVGCTSMYVHMCVEVCAHGNLLVLILCKPQGNEPSSAHDEANPSTFFQQGAVRACV